MITLESLAMHSAEIVDCRMLQLEIEFYQLDVVQLKRFSASLLNKIHEWFKSNCYIEWNNNNHKVGFDKLLKQSDSSTGYIIWDFSGDVISPVVYNRSTYRKYDIWLEDQLNFAKVNSHIPIDYFDIFDSCIPQSKDPALIKKGLLELYNKKGLFKKAYWRDHDLGGWMFSVPYRNHKELYHGTANVSIALACLGDSCVAWAEKFSDFLVELSCEVKNISGRVMSSPIGCPAAAGSGHMVYFASDVSSFTCPLGIMESEWRDAYYLRGAEWFNLLSPIQTERLQLPTPAKHDTNSPVFKRLSNNAIIIKSCKDILHTDIPELAQVKDYLRSVLYPGSRKFDITFLEPRKTEGFGGPRTQWEVVPMLPEEIDVTDQYIRFHFLNKIT